MMNKFCIYLVTLVLLTACNSKQTAKNATATAATTPSGFTIDYGKQEVDTILLSKTDLAFVVKNKAIKDDMGDKQKDYTIQVYFTNLKWPKLSFKNAIGADLALAGDLDGDHQTELLLRPEWFSSCWSTVNLFSLKNNAWKLVKNGSMYFCSDQYPLSKRVVKTASGYGLLTDSLTDDKFITLKKTIKF